MKNELLTDQMIDRIEDLKDQIFKNQNEVAAIALSDKFDTVRIKQLCNETNIISNQIETLQQFIDAQFSASNKFPDPSVN